MTKKKPTRDGKVNVTTWLFPDEVEQLDAIVNEKTESLQEKYPGLKLTRHSVLQRAVREWLEGQKS